MPESLIRCFIAVELPADLLKEISEYTQKLSEQTSGIRWVRPSGMHITLKFLGEINASRVEDIRKNLVSISNVVEPFTLGIRGAGCFPNRRQPKVIWLGLEHDPVNSLFKLHNWLEDKLSVLGFDKEKRRFSPHLTLGRIKYPGDFKPLFDYLDQNTFPGRIFRVDKISLIRSTLQPSGAVYTKLADYTLH